MIYDKIKKVLLVSSLFINSTFAQNISWEFVRSFDSNDSIIPNKMQSMTELESGDIVVNASWINGNVNGINSENPGLMKFSADGVLQKEVYWSRFGYRSDDQYIIESPDHNIIVMGHFLPDRDPECSNFLLEGSDKAYLYFYKLDNDFNMLDSIEYLFPLDTTNNAAFYQSTSFHTFNISMAKIKLTSAFLEEGHIVGSYTKTQTRYNNYALDSLFFFKMDFEGNMLMQTAISLGDRGSDPYAFNDQMISNDIGYVHYHIRKNDGKNDGDYCILVDKDFRFVKNMGIPVLEYDGPRIIDFELVSKSPWGTTFLSSLIDYTYNYSYRPNPLLMEIDENEEYVHVIHRKEAISSDYDMTALRSPVCFTQDGIIWAYTRDRGLHRDRDSWIVIEKLNRDFDVVQEVYYPYQENTNLNANSYIVSRDGGVILLSYCHELEYPNIKHYILTKFPKEAFVDLKEINNSQKTPIAYWPNPSKDALHLHFSPDVQPAQAELYDLQGRLVRTWRNGLETLSLQGLAPGTYSMRVTLDDGSVFTDKVVKE